MKDIYFLVSERIPYEQLCKENCEHLIKIRKKDIGDAGTLRNPEPYTYEYDGFVCGKYKEELGMVREIGSFTGTPVKNIPPLKHSECDCEYKGIKHKSIIDSYINKTLKRIK